MNVEQLYDTFLSVPPEACAYDTSRVVLVRAPYDSTVSYMPGTRRGPAAIMEASHQVELWDRELKREPWRIGIHTIPALFPSASGPESMVNSVEAVCGKILDDGKIAFVLGGEHSVTIGAARAYAARYPGISFLQIDAHLDLRNDYEGTPYSHACAGRRLAELGPLTHVGVRVACPEEMEAIEHYGLRPVWGDELYRVSDEKWIDRVIGQLGKRVYVTFDVDGLDPSVIPATGTPVPGGLLWYQALDLLKTVGERCEVVGCDVVELSPIAGQHASDFAVAQLVYKMIGYFFQE